MKKIKVLIPNSGMDNDTLRDREAMLSTMLSSDTVVSVDCSAGGPASIESCTDEVLAEPYILNAAMKAEAEGYSAFVIYCFSDAGLAACRELVSIPVIGPGDASMALAATLGTKISVITTREDNVKRTYTRLSKSVWRNALVSVRPIGIDVLSLREKPEATQNALLEICRKCVEFDGADVIVLGCLGMANYGQIISKKLGVPVVDPAFAAVTLAQTCIMLNISHSRNNLPIVSSNTLDLIDKY